MFPRLLRLSLVVAAPVLAVACAEQSENDRPIIDSVEAPLVVRERNGAYAIPVTLLFHDNDGEAITRLRYRLLPNIDAVVDVPAPNPTRESAQVTLVIPAADLDGEVPSTRSSRSDDDGKHDDDRDRARSDSRARPRTLQLSIVDYRGAESLTATSTVTLD
jgi:hypothetical protein